MDSIDEKLVNILQLGLPLEKDPYKIVAEQLGISKQEIIKRLKKLQEKGYIRRIGGSFNTQALGYKSTLIGMHVPENIFPEVALFVNDNKGVTHNYKRNSFLNMWFSLSVNQESIKYKFLDTLREKFFLEHVLEFPSQQIFKLRVFFDMESR